MSSLVEAAILGVIQGLTEFLPISSTAHLLIAEQLLGFEDPDGVFTVMIQLGSILAIVWLYRERLLSVLTGLRSRPDARRFALTILVAFVPALVAGAFLAPFVKNVLYESFGIIGAAFVVGGVAMLLLERLRPAPDVTSVDAVPVRRAFGIGLCQTLALVPGVSRSGATIIGGLAMGLDRPVAAEFSFFLAIPTLTAAFAHELLEVSGNLDRAPVAEIAVGFVTAFIASLLVVKPFLGIVRRAGFALFAWYRIAAGAVLLAAVYFS